MRLPRLLLATCGWPSGILDLGSWIRRQGLAEVVVFQMQPAFVFRLDGSFRDELNSGRLSERLRDEFEQHGFELAPFASAERETRAEWVIRDDDSKIVFRLVEGEQSIDVLLVENLKYPIHPLDSRVRSHDPRPTQFGDADSGWHVPERSEGRGEPENATATPFAEAQGRATPLNWRTHSCSNPQEAGGKGQLVPRDNARELAASDTLKWLGGAMLARLGQFRPHVVGFRIEGGQFEEICRYIRAVRAVSDAEIILGGPTATSHPVEVLEQCGADYLFVGEAEEPLAQFLRLARRRNSRDHLTEIPGLVYRFAGRTYVNTLPTDGYGQASVQGPRPVQARSASEWILPEIAGTNPLACASSLYQALAECRPRPN
jgi:hypothetical protein